MIADGSAPTRPLVLSASLARHPHVEADARHALDRAVRIVGDDVDGEIARRAEHDIVKTGRAAGVGGVFQGGGVQADTSAERPSVSDTGCSCRSGEHILPAAVMNSMPLIHSAGVRLTSRAKAWRCLTADAMIAFRRGSGVVAIWSSTASVIVSGVNSRMRHSPDAGYFLRRRPLFHKPNRLLGINTRRSRAARTPPHTN